MKYGTGIMLSDIFLHKLWSKDYLRVCCDVNLFFPPPGTVGVYGSTEKVKMSICRNASNSLSDPCQTVQAATKKKKPNRFVITNLSDGEM